MLDLIDVLNCFGSLFYNNNWSLMSVEFQKANGLAAQQTQNTIAFSVGDFLQSHNL